MKTHWTTFLLITFSLVVTSCVPRTSIVLDDTSCQAPCWRNISMGMKDTYVVSLLNGMKDIDKNSICIGPTSKPFWDEEVHWEFTGSQGIYQGIYFHDGKAVMMYFEEKGLVLSKAIQKYGKPNQIWALSEDLDGLYLRIIFMYPSKGICYENVPGWPYPNLSAGTYQVVNSLAIKDIYYFDPSVDLAQFDIGCIWPIDKNLIQPWKGYGDYQVYSAK